MCYIEMYRITPNIFKHSESHKFTQNPKYVISHNYTR